MDSPQASSRDQARRSARLSAWYNPPTPEQQRSDLLRRLFIAVCAALFLVYCWASVAYQNQLKVPDYRLATVNLLGGKTRGQWEDDENYRFQRLIVLENKHYQLPPDAKVMGPHGSEIPASRPLTGSDFAFLIKNAASDDALQMQLRDPVDIEDIANLGYLLRDPVYDPLHPHDQPIVPFGVPVDKVLITALNGLGIKAVTVVGEGTPVGFDIGTGIMVLIIFLCLAAALKPILWDPFQALLDRRQKELAIGAEAARQNQLEEVKLEEDKKRQNAKLMQEMQAKRMKAQQDVARETGAIIKTAKADEKRDRHAELQRINAESRLASKRLEEEIPAMAEAIAASVLRTSTGDRTDDNHGG
jgi:F0F1-type ATP synthase, subunit b